MKQADKNLGLVPIRGDYYNATLRKWLKEPDFLKVSFLPYLSVCHRLHNIVKSS